MRTKRVLRAAVAFLFAFGVLAADLTPLRLPPQTASAVTQADIDKLKKESNALSSKKSEVNKQLSALKKDKANTLKRKALLDQQIDLISEEIANYSWYVTAKNGNNTLDSGMHQFSLATTTKDLVITGVFAHRGKIVIITDGLLDESLDVVMDYQFFSIADFAWYNGYGIPVEIVTGEQSGSKHRELKLPDSIYESQGGRLHRHHGLCRRQEDQRPGRLPAPGVSVPAWHIAVLADAAWVNPGGISAA